MKVVTLRTSLAALMATGGLTLALGTNQAGAVTPGTISTIAGTGTAGHTGDGGPATAAEIDNPLATAVDASGNLYVAGNTCVVRKITPAGVISTFAGNGTCGFAGDGGPAIAAEFSSSIRGVAIDRSGNVYLTDSANARVRKVAPNGVVTTFAGTGASGHAGDGGPATLAQLNDPWGIATDRSGDVVISDAINDTIREVSPAGTITRVVGTGVTGYSGDGGQATLALVNFPAGLWVDASGNLIFADRQNHVVRQVNPAGVISTIAGNHTPGSSGDGGPALSAELNTPNDVTADTHGAIYVVDIDGSVVRKIQGGTISNVAGTGTPSSTGNGGPATAATLDEPASVTFDADGNLIIADFGAQNIRQVSLTAPTGQGYTMGAVDGDAFTFAPNHADMSTGPIANLNKPIVGMAATPDGDGHWLVATDGGIFSLGTAQFYGSTGAIRLNKPVVGMASTPDGKGYWLVATDGGIFSFGDAQFYGSTGAIRLNKPVVGMASTPDGKGYWLVATDGGIFSFGDAQFYGSTGAITLNKPVVGMASTPDAAGYWMVASDGGIFSFGDATFHGSTGAIHLNQPIVGMASTPDAQGYWLVASDGGIFTEGNAGFFGTLSTFQFPSEFIAHAGELNTSIVGITATP